MLSQFETALAVGPCFVGNEEIEILHDIKNRCFFPNKKAHAKFLQQVCKSVGADTVETILEDDFEKAFNVAMTILRERGEAILNGKLRHENLALGKKLKESQR